MDVMAELRPAGALFKQGDFAAGLTKAQEVGIASQNRRLMWPTPTSLWSTLWRSA